MPRTDLFRVDVLATSMFSFANVGAAAIGRMRVVSKIDASGCWRPSKRSASSMPAAVPLLIPHFRKPVVPRILARGRPGSPDPGHRLAGSPRRSRRGLTVPAGLPAPWAVGAPTTPWSGRPSRHSVGGRAGCAGAPSPRSRASARPGVRREGGVPAPDHPASHQKPLLCWPRCRSHSRADRVAGSR